MTSSRQRVVVVDDHGLFRAGVIAEIGDHVEVVGQADDVIGAVEVIEATEPDVVLLDVHLPGGNGRAVIESIAPRFPDVRFLALSVSDAEQDVIDTVRAGARGYVTKAIDSDDLIDAIGRVAEGDAVFSPRLAGFVLDAFSRVETTPDDAELDQLTPREKDVLRHLARGYTYKEVARRLEISIKTVETHASAVLRKLQLSSRHELSRWAARRHIV